MSHLCIATDSQLYKILTMENWTSLILLYLISSLLQASSAFVLGKDSSLNKDRCPNSVAHGRFLHTFREKCYEFVIYQEKYWKDARNDCMRKGGDLVVVDDASIQTFLVNTLISMGKTKDGIWIGLTDIHHELHWEWVNGEPLQRYTNWAHLQGGANFLHLTQDCAQIQMNDHGLWHDRECHLWPNKFSYICEYDMSRPTTSYPSTLSKLPSKSYTSTLSKLSTTALTPTSSKLFSSAYPSTLSKLPAKEDILTLSKLSTTSATSTSSLSASLPSSSELSTTATLLRTSTRVMLSRMSTALNVASKTTIISPEVTNFTVDKFKTSDKKYTLEHMTKPTTDIAKYSQTSSPLVGSSQLPYTVITEEIIICSELNCAQSCLNGYSGVYVGLDGCINCRCN